MKTGTKHSEESKRKASLSHKKVYGTENRTPSQANAIRRESGRAYRARAKAAVFAHYGTSCACCGEGEPRFLTIDHIDNNGAVHKKEIKRTALYPWLVRNGFPTGFQTLCYNCNCAKRFGPCPHQVANGIMS